MTPHRAKLEIVGIGKSLFDRRLVHSTAGNISIRLSDGTVLITATNACLGFLPPEDIAQVDPEGKELSRCVPSKMVAVHLAIYKGQPDAMCVIHTHSTACVGLTLNSKADCLAELRPLTPYFVMKVGQVPVLPYLRPGHPDLPEQVAQRISEAVSAKRDIRAVLFSRLGPIVWNRSSQGAMATLEELEENARLQLMTGWRAQDLLPEQIADLHHAFGVN